MIKKKAIEIEQRPVKPPAVIASIFLLKSYYQSH